MIVVLTGITGLVGSHAAMALLGAGHSVLGLARSRNGKSAAKRVRGILEAAPEYGRGFNVAGLHVVEADLLHEQCGLDAETLATLCGTVDVLVHCAGDVMFRPGQDPGALRVNVEGGLRVVALARRIGCRRIVHVSTAYLEPGVRRTEFRTRYEASKQQGEDRIREQAGYGGIDLRIVRPSIVTGDAVHGFTPTYHGIYPFLRYGARYCDALQRIPRAARLPAGFVSDGRINLVPADVVAAIIREVACRPALEDREFNVVNPEPWRAADLVDILSSYLGLAEPGPHGAVDAALPEEAVTTLRLLAEAYAPYFDVELRVDSSSTQRLMQRAGIDEVTNRREWIVALLDWGIRNQWKELA